MSAPAGWHLQPDGRERYWDGTQWTEQFRAPLPVDPTAPPPPPSWAPSVDETQALDVTGTRAMPVPAPAEQPGPAAPPVPGQPAYDPAQPAYDQPAPQQAGYPQPTYPQQGYPQTGYGAPGGYAPPPARSSGVAKGCLIAAVIGFLVVGAVVVAAIFLFGRAVDTVSDGISSSFPSGLPTELPTALPTEGLEEPVEISVGDGFELPRATIEAGWSLEAQGSGIPVVNVTGMRAEVADGEGFPVLFTLAVTDSSGGQVETVCTAPSGSPGATVDVSCVPLFGDVADATRATVTASL